MIRKLTVALTVTAICLLVAFGVLGTMRHDSHARDCRTERTVR